MEKNKIVIGSLRQETNSFSPVITTYDDFSVFRGASMLDKVAVSDMFAKAGYDVVPTLMAYAMPSGKVSKETYLAFKKDILAGIPVDGSVAGVWLYLHGAMNVVGIGSGEGPLVSEVRKLVGPHVPIAVALDFHANNTAELIENANIICGYRTAPHVDGVQTQQKTAGLLIRSIRENLMPKCVMFRPPLLLPGEMVTTGVEPAKTLIIELDKAEQREGVWTASLFGCMPWSDAPNTGVSVVVCGSADSIGPLEEAKRLAGLYWDARKEFKFEEEAAEPGEALKMALLEKNGPVFISDSGDNVTAGAAGDNAYLLRLLLEAGCHHALVAGLVDKAGTDAFSMLAIGESIQRSIGGSIDKESTKVVIKGILKQKGIFKNPGKKDTKYVLIRIEGADVLLTDSRCSFTTKEAIEETGANIQDYHMIIVKLGYLFPDLRKISKRSIMALTKGSSALQMETFAFKQIQRPMYPLDKTFNWAP